MTVELHGYHYSVYNRIARMALAEKGVAYTTIEVNPFAEDMPAVYLHLHPFRRVPTLVHDGFVLYETSAITRYVDEAFEGPALQPGGPRERARMAQIVSIVDSYAYWPLVRQVFSHRVFRPRLGHAPDEAEVREGLAAAPRVLGALDALAETAVNEGPHLLGEQLTLADIHLAPMMAYFALAPEAADLIAACPRLGNWWRAMVGRDGLAATDPGLPDPPAT